MTTRTSTTRRRRLIAVIAAAVLLVLGGFLLYRPEPGLLSVRFVAFTNFPGQRQPTALFAATNHSGATLHIADLVEVKTAGWPVYGPDMQAMWRSWPAVPPHQATTLAIPVPDYGSAWRVRVAYSEALGKWETTRSAWAASLHARKMHAAARVIWRGKPCRDTVTTEMKI